MRKLTRLAACALILSAGVVACEPQEQEQAEEQMEAAAADFQSEMREFRMDSRERLDRVDQRIAELEAHLENIDEETRAELQEEIDELRRGEEQLEQRLERMEANSEQAWNDLKRGLDSSLSSLERSIDDAFNEYDIEVEVEGGSY